MLANRGDLVLVAGKGHETYQDIKGVKHHFDDREELAKALLTKLL
jgi:UDP-N-acetylmuramoyl-L-alanyl-D-glutamate--2,6-diaminopimelate ligase